MGMEWDANKQQGTYLLLVVKALVVVIQCGQTLLLSGFSLSSVDNVAA